MSENTSMTIEYKVRIHHEEDSYWAEVLELPGCFVAGDSLDEIWEALPEAVAMYLSTSSSPRLCIANSAGISWIEQAGLVRLAERVTSDMPEQLDEHGD